MNMKQLEEQGNQRFLNPSYPSNRGLYKDGNQAYECPQCGEEGEMEGLITHTCLSMKDIASVLLHTSVCVHDAENIQIQNYTNTLTDGQINRLWSYAKQHNLHRFREDEARFITKADLERLANPEELMYT